MMSIKRFLSQMSHRIKGTPPSTAESSDVGSKGLENREEEAIPKLSEDALFLLSELKELPAFIACHLTPWGYHGCSMRSTSDLNEIVFRAPDSETRRLFDGVFEELRCAGLIVDLEKSDNEMMPNFPNIEQLQSQTRALPSVLFMINKKGLYTLERCITEVSKIRIDGAPLFLKVDSIEKALQAQQKEKVEVFETLMRRWKP